MRTRVALGLLAAALLAGCGGAASASPDRVVRAWSRAIDTGDNEAAAALFAPGAVVIQSGQIVLATHADAVRWNAALPCAGRIVEVTTNGTEATATFVLGMRPGHVCTGPGQRAAAVFTVEHGKIVLWHQIPVPTAGTGAPSI